MTANRLLDLLPREARARLDGALTGADLAAGGVLAEPGAAPEVLYFPEGAILSSVVPMRDGRAVEAAVVGCDGIAPVSGLFGVGAPSRVVVQVPGRALAIDAAAFRKELDADSRLRSVVFGYANLYASQVSLVAACNRLHDLQGRLAKWLLLCRDRAMDDRLPLTHDAAAQMLGVRRAGVTVALAELQAKGLLRLERSSVAVDDAEGLAAEACECYDRLRTETEAFVRSVRAQARDAAST